MKANELMIDDWVLWKDKPVQIARVSGVVYSFGHIDVTLAHCGNGVLETHDIKSISPIPLTPEIIEKNGFVDEMSNHAYRTDNYHVCYYCADARLSINKYGAILDVHCFYVHQLQHALRLCGIEKEIVL